MRLSWASYDIQKGSYDPLNFAIIGCVNWIIIGFWSVARVCYTCDFTLGSTWTVTYEINKKIVGLIKSYSFPIGTNNLNVIMHHASSSWHWPKSSFAIYQAILWRKRSLMKRATTRISNSMRVPIPALRSWIAWAYVLIKQSQLLGDSNVLLKIFTGSMK